MKALLISKHQKEQSLLKPLLDVGIELSVWHDFDTDQLGTFSGTITRTLSPIDAAIAKARAGRASTPGFDWYIGSEGSFFPDPTVPFITRHHELLVALPSQHEIPVVSEVSQLISWAIDQEVSSEEAFLQLIDGDLSEGKEHAFLSLPGAPPQERIEVASGRGALVKAYQQLSRNGELPIQVMSDLRAHRSKNRRQLIEQAAQALAAKLATQCPNCGQKGFGIRRLLPGLPCAWCLNPTGAVRAQLWSCPFCNYQEEKSDSGSGPFADPGMCGICNP